MPSSAEGRKKSDPSVGATPTEDLIFFDSKNMISRFLSSQEIRQKMHIGMAECHDSPSELWHSHAWASSIRTTSGEYAHYSDEQPLFPSDMVMYHCSYTPCVQQHLGRVYEIGRDFRSDRFNRGEITVRIQEALLTDMAITLAHTSISLSTLLNERILSGEIHDVPQENVLKQIQNVVFDYVFEDSKAPGRSIIPSPDLIIIRRVLKKLEDIFIIHPLCYTTPLRAELEFRQYSRSHFITNFNNQQCISVPYLTFINRFSLYRNSYRSLMGMYLIFAAFAYRERTRRANVLPLTLGPHGSNFSDVIEAMQSLAVLEKGLMVQINGKDVFLTALYIGDMPQ